MRRKYLVLLLIPLVIALAGCGKKKYVAPLPELEPPSNLTATTISYKQVNLSWQDNSTIEDGFRVCCDMGGNQYQTVDTLPANSMSFEHYGLQPLTKYTYYVQAYKGTDYASSREVSATTSCPIEILWSKIYASSNWGATVYGDVKNNAVERCKVQLEITFFDPNGNAYGSATDDFTMGGEETRRFSIVYGRYEQSSLPGYAIEVTKAEILY